MPQQIEVPGMGVVEFPDGMTDDQIVAAIKKNTMLGTAQAPSATESPNFMKRAVLSSPLLMGGPMAGMEGAGGFDENLNRIAFKLGGATTDVLAGNVPPAVAAGAGFGTNLLTQIGATFATGAAGAKIGKPVFEAGARRLMQSAVKPVAADLKTGKAARAIDTLLNEGVSPNQAGIEKLRAKVTDLDNEIDTVIGNSKAMVNKARVGGALRKAFDNFRMQVNPDADVATIRRAWEQFKNHPLIAGKVEFPVQTAQAMKRATDRSLGSKAFGELKGAETEAQKGLRFGLKEEISRVVPEVSLLNKSESELLNAISVAERRALMELNKNPLGLSLIAPNKTALVAFLADKSAAFKALFARMLFSGSRAIPGTLAATAVAPTAMRSGGGSLEEIVRLLSSGQLGQGENVPDTP